MMNTKQTARHILKCKTIWKSTNQVAEIAKKKKKAKQINQQKNYIHWKLVESSLFTQIH